MRNAWSIGGTHGTGPFHDGVTEQRRRETGSRAADTIDSLHGFPVDWSFGVWGASRWRWMAGLDPWV